MKIVAVVWVRQVMVGGDRFSGQSDEKEEGEMDRKRERERERER